MDIDDNLLTRRCYKCDQPVLDNLNIECYNSSTSMVVLWNKYQIFVYEDIKMKSPKVLFIPEFQVHRVIASNNYLVCLDRVGNVHLTSLKFKNSSQKQLSISFQPRDQGVMTCIRQNEDKILILKYDAYTYFLCLHKINTDFQIEKKLILLFNKGDPPRHNSIEKYLLTNYTVDEAYLEKLKEVFNTKESLRNVHELVVLSFDKYTVYGCLFAPKIVEHTITLLKLYTCPAEICNMEIINSGELYLLIGLAMGTVIRLSLNEPSKTPDVVHLNAALYKMVALKDSLLYTDGMTMWESKNTFTKDIKFSQFFVRDTNDFAKCGEEIICTTFTKLIYTFSVDDNAAYLIPETSDEYCPAEKLLNNFDYLEKIFEVIDRNNELVKKLSSEEDYITALAMANRQDVVDKAIESTILVFENYEEVDKTELTLTEDMKEYFEPENWLILVKITNLNIYNSLNNILLHLLEQTMIYITLYSPRAILKTTTLKMEEPLKKVNFLIPLNMRNVETEVNVNIEIIVRIPEGLNLKQTCLSLYRKSTVLSSEHFIKMSKKNTVQCLKRPKETIEELIYKSNLLQHGNLFTFTDISKVKEKKQWSFYVKLPNNYHETFRLGVYCQKYLHSSKSAALVEQFSAKEFLNAKSHIMLNIGNESCTINVLNDGFSNPQLKVTGENIKVAFNIRNFFSNMIYNDYENYEPEEDFINSYAFYTTTENHMKAVNDCITSRASIEELLPLIDQFEKNIVGALPL